VIYRIGQEKISLWLCDGSIKADHGAP